MIYPVAIPALATGKIIASSSGNPSLYNKLIILDLDETLLHSSEVGLAREPDVLIGHYLTYIRPFTSEFIQFCFLNFSHVAVWTSASTDYANAACAFLFGSQRDQLAFVWANTRCTQKFNPEFYDWDWIKDLKKVKRRGFPLEHIIMVDNTPSKLRRQYGNLVRVNDFMGSLADKELLFLMHYLPKLGMAANVRTVEKRGWRNEVEKSWASLHPPAAP